MKLGTIKVSKFSYLLGANLLPAIYLLWWDQRGQFTPAAHTPIWKSDLIALISMILLVLLFITAFLFVIKMKFNWKWLLCYLPFALYWTDLHHGKKEFSWRGCDMSICERLNLFSDGTFYYSHSGQTESYHVRGVYEIVGDSVIMAMNRSKMPLMEYNPFPNKRCLILHPLDFKISWGNTVCQ